MGWGLAGTGNSSAVVAAAAVVAPQGGWGGLQVVTETDLFMLDDRAELVGLVDKAEQGWLIPITTLREMMGQQ